LSYQPYLDQLIAFASHEDRKPDLLAAKAEYFQRTGEVFEDDKQFETRMASFLDHFLFDRPRPESGKTPAQEARLIPFDGALVFSSAFCFHPREAVKAIKKEVKRRKKVMPDAPPVDLTWEAAKRALKADRYRQIAVDKIYDFESSRL